MGSLSIPELPTATRTEFMKAVRRVVKEQASRAGAETTSSDASDVGASASAGKLPDYEQLHRAAERFVRGHSGESAQRFAAMLECAYLVAAADGLAEREVTALIELVSTASGTELDAARLAPVLGDYDRRLRETGRSELLGELAERLGDFMAREEALNFAILIALADGSFARKEARVLIEMSEAFGFSLGELQLGLNAVGASLTRALTRG